MLVVIQVAAAEEGSESYTQAKEAATTAEEEAAAWQDFESQPFAVEDCNDCILCRYTMIYLGHHMNEKL